MIIEMIQDDIDCAREGSEACPIYQAITRIYPRFKDHLKIAKRSYGYCAEFYREIAPCEAPYCYYYLNRDCQKFASAFDGNMLCGHNNKLTPITFELHIPTQVDFTFI